MERPKIISLYNLLNSSHIFQGYSSCDSSYHSSVIFRHCKDWTSQKNFYFCDSKPPSWLPAQDHPADTNNKKKIFINFFKFEI